MKSFYNYHYKIAKLVALGDIHPKIACMLLNCDYYQLNCLIELQQHCAPDIYVIRQMSINKTKSKWGYLRGQYNRPHLS